MVEIIEIKEKSRVAVLGLGVSGRSAAGYALFRGAEVLISDSRPEKQLSSEERALLSLPRVKWEAGGHSHQFLAGANLVLLSPGVDPDLPLLADLRRQGVPVVGELAIVAGHLPVPLIAVSGTNGKTTVTTLIGELLAEGGKKVFVGGNIGTPLYDYLRDPAGYEYVVAELSSFQLQSAGAFTPDIAVLLNITPDHLDRHHDFAAYRAAKMQLFANRPSGTPAILNGDDPVCREIAAGLGHGCLLFGRGADCAARPEGEGVTLLWQGDQERYHLQGTPLALGMGPLNAAAAILAGRCAGCRPQEIQAALRRFRPLAHRLELVGEVDGVSFYDDSKATNTGAVVAALAHFAAPVVLIAGGRDKGDDYRLLRPAVAGRVKKVVLLGEAAGLLEKALADVVVCVRAESMAEAVSLAAAAAGGAGVVLLSPACASFDMFRSYGHRGEEFRRAVGALAAGGYCPREAAG
jgi:UDP-N-acetylmuramoylalanine--D-glutamate ligase